MGLGTVILIIVAIAALVALVNVYGPDFRLSPVWIKFINAVAIVAIVLWLFRLYGVWDYINTVKVGN